MSEIKIILPPYAERTKLGKLFVIDNGRPKFTCTAYGKADGKSAAAKGNPTRDALKKFGDTPFGGYGFQVEKINVTTHPPRTYGEGYIIRLLPQSGDAKKAMENGRGGLLIHGGDLNAEGRLRPTNGCVRVSNNDMKGLIEALHGAKSGTCEITEFSLLKSTMLSASGVDEMMDQLDGATGGEDEMIEYPEEEVGGEDRKIE